jgi:DNA-binding PadR family transcriptional regulator
VVLDGYEGSWIGSQGPRGYYRGTMSWREEVREIIVQLEDQRRRLQEVRERARRQGGPEGERLEAQAEARLRDIEQRIDDLRASLEHPSE